MKTRLFRFFTLLSLSLVLALPLFGCASNEPASVPEEKSLTIQVIDKDQQTTTFEVSTTAAFLDEVLLEHGIVENDQSTYGLYILTADGETADESNQEWWCVTRGGERLATGASDTPVSDGEEYELTLTVGY